jgi:DNA-binding NtrC family response regulator
MSSYVLIVQGTQETRSLLEAATAKLGLRSRFANDGAEALRIVEEEAVARISLVIQDAHLADAQSLVVLQELRENLSVPIIVLADTQAFGAAQDTFDAGASDFLIKPISADRICIAIKNALKIRALEGEIARITRKMDGRLSFSDIISTSQEMGRAVTLGRRAADLDLPVLIEGELGTGKELFAKAIHGDSPTMGKPFIMVHCSDPASAARWSTRGSLLEDSWTEADGGVLFLDEIGELPLAAQDKLASLLFATDASKQLSTPKRDVRLICTTSQNLIDLVKAGDFREDLYYRINVFPVWLPPLRERLDDMKELVDHFLAQFAADQGKRIDSIDEEALQMLKAYSWPGNVRQLENTIYRAVVLAESNELTIQDFPQIAASLHNMVMAMPPAPMSDAKPLYEGPAMIGSNWPSPRSVTPTSGGASALGIPALTNDGQIRSLNDIEADLIRLALGHYRGHITEAARRLGIGRSTLYRKMREFGLEMRHN